mmetsp:Transcript_53443/g.159921  ORF Transcript_53443/g.159921 Transcript_53443/m.159921 type:complete len:286 (-) Transcript_53443:1052-1909(-)
MTRTVLFSVGTKLGKISPTVLARVDLKFEANFTQCFKLLLFRHGYIPFLCSTLFHERKCMPRMRRPDCEFFIFVLGRNMSRAILFLILFQLLEPVPKALFPGLDTNLEVDALQRLDPGGCEGILLPTQYTLPLIPLQHRPAAQRGVHSISNCHLGGKVCRPVLFGVGTKLLESAPPTWGRFRFRFRPCPRPRRSFALEELASISLDEPPVAVVMSPSFSKDAGISLSAPFAKSPPSRYPPSSPEMAGDDSPPSPASSETSVIFRFPSGAPFLPADSSSELLPSDS